MAVVMRSPIVADPKGMLSHAMMDKRPFESGLPVILSGAKDLRPSQNARFFAALRMTDWLVVRF